MAHLLPSNLHSVPLPLSKMVADSVVNFLERCQSYDPLAFLEVAFGTKRPFWSSHDLKISHRSKKLVLTRSSCIQHVSSVVRFYQHRNPTWCLKAATGAKSTEETEGINVEDLKKAVIRAVANTSRGKATTPEQRQQILKLITELESRNRTNNPVNSVLLSGYWSLLYTAPVDEKTSDKYAGTQEGPFLARMKPLAFGSVKQTRSSQVIDTVNGVAKNIADFTFFGIDGTLTIKGKAARSAIPGKQNVRLDVTFEEFVVRFGSWKTPAVSLHWINPRGWVDTTFLDNDLRVGRGDKGSIFVSARVKA